MQHQGRTFDALPDPADFRDRLFEPTLVEVPMRIALEDHDDQRGYLSWSVPILDQGKEGACTGFALATVANYLLRRRRVIPDHLAVSARMFYEMAKRYDEWAGEEYSGSSARGAVKGWHKHGICSEELAPYKVSENSWQLTSERLQNALTRPLGSYLRVNHKDLVSMHAALAEVGTLFATAQVHSGWFAPKKDGLIRQEAALTGAHAFAIVAYDVDGFWIQNSWGTAWGRNGFGLLSYDDWLENGFDVWVCRLGAPVVLRTAQANAQALASVAGQSATYAHCDVRPHIVAIGNDGRLRTSGTYGTSEGDVRRLFQDDYVAATSNWTKPKLLLYAHGGLVGEKDAVQRVADYKATLLKEEIYPVAFIWKTDFWTTLRNILEDAQQERRPEGVLDASLDFLLDRLDNVLEPLARRIGGKASWDEMKENGLLATRSEQGACRVAVKELRTLLARLKKDGKPVPEIHLVAHSAGSIFFAPLVELLVTKGRIKAGRLRGREGLGAAIKTVTLWAPAITMELFKETYLPSIKKAQIQRFALYTLTDTAENDDDCARIYNKSLLFLISRAFEVTLPLPFRPGTPILGMERYIEDDASVMALFDAGVHDWVRAPNGPPQASTFRSAARRHGEFDDDKETLRSTFARILGSEAGGKQELQLQKFASQLRERRDDAGFSTQRGL